MSYLFNWYNNVDESEILDTWHLKRIRFASATEGRNERSSFTLAA